MPIVLTNGAGERTGYTYDDQTGVSYEYPLVYDKWIRPGERFIYHRTRKGTRKSAYTGAGVIGAVRPSLPGRLVCDIEHFIEFDDVHLKDSSGAYYEGAVYWAQGVRPITEDCFEAILAAASATPATTSSGAGGTSSATGGSVSPATGRSIGYPSSKMAREVDAYAMTVAMAEVASLYPAGPIERMPHNNPGFDIRVGPKSAPTRFVEVKGTSTSEPVFFLSEGEREFSVANKAAYTLLVVVGIDLKAKTHTAIVRREGAIDATVADLKTTQWRGRLL